MPQKLKMIPIAGVPVSAQNLFRDLHSRMETIYGGCTSKEREAIRKNLETWVEELGEGETASATAGR